MDGGWWREATEGGKMEVACWDSGGELGRIFERNTATRVSEQAGTSALCKNNLSNYQEGLPASLSAMFYCTTPPFSHIHLLYIFGCSHILPLIMWFGGADWNCSLSFIKTDGSVNILWLASVGSPRNIWLSIPRQNIVFNVSPRMYGRRRFHYPFKGL